MTRVAHSVVTSFEPFVNHFVDLACVRSASLSSPQEATRPTPSTRDDAAIDPLADLDGLAEARSAGRRHSGTAPDHRSVCINDTG